MEIKFTDRQVGRNMCRGTKIVNSEFLAIYKILSVLYFALSVAFICYKQAVKTGMTAKMAAILDINVHRVLQKKS